MIKNINEPEVFMRAIKEDFYWKLYWKARKQRRVIASFHLMNALSKEMQKRFRVSY